MEINELICNKCFATMYRGKRPFHITQCGHVFCQGCLQQVEKQCPQCQRIGSISLPLEEPLSPKLIPYFTPIVETLETLVKVESFRANQLKINHQRFNYELDKKYELLKTQYWKKLRALKELTEKYIILNEKFKEIKKLQLSIEQIRNTPQTVFSKMVTPSDSGIYMNHASSISGISMDSSTENLKTLDFLTPRSFDLTRNQYRNDGFRIPSRKPPRARFSEQS